MPVKKSVRPKKPAARDLAGTPAVSSASRNVTVERGTSRSFGTAAVVLVAAACLTGVAMLFGAAGGGQAAVADRPVLQASSGPAAAPTASTVAPAVDTAKTVSAAHADPGGRPSSVVSGAVTVEGCLERTGDGFRLKDTAGDAPKTRSWKSGFLRKGSPPVTIVGASKGIALAAHVGERVSASGSLIDRDMHVVTLRRLSTSCK